MERKLQTIPKHEHNITTIESKQPSKLFLFSKQGNRVDSQETSKQEASKHLSWKLDIYLEAVHVKDVIESSIFINNQH